MPLMMPAMLRMRLAARPSRRALIIGIPPATAASNCTMTFFSSASGKISLPYSASSFLLAVTMCLPFSMAFNTASLAMPVPPNNSTTTSTSSRVTSSNGSLTKAADGQIWRAFSSLKSHTALMRTSRPKRRLISAALSRNTAAVPPPTVPKPKRPMFTGFIVSPCKPTEM